ncbi:MAG: Hsp70 family protein [Alphaproteobacteria bacterium]|nr:MAG: Hsp70 family protein [Alphaproteobacteria bacterium]
MFIGIDFGTSNSAIGVVRPEGVGLIDLENDQPTLPTVLFFDTAGGVAFGRAAMTAYADALPGRFMRSIKSILGTALAEDRTMINKRSTTFVEIVATFLDHLRKKAKAETGDLAENVVLGRPVFFVDYDKKADALAQEQLEHAARLAGFRHIAFQFEPIAAAFDYEQRVTGEELVLIADIGGGTSDFSVVRVGPDRRAQIERHQDILANGGVHIGGNDFDRCLSMACAMPALGYGSFTHHKHLPIPARCYFDLSSWHRIHLLYTHRTVAELRHIRREAEHPELIDRLIHVIENRFGHRLSFEVESAKIRLSSADMTSLDLGFCQKDLCIPASRAVFEQENQSHIERMSQALARTIQDSGVPAQRIGSVVCTGGASRIPAVHQAIALAVPTARVQETDAFASVATGLALDSKRRFS